MSMGVFSGSHHVGSEIRTDRNKINDLKEHINGKSSAQNKKKLHELRHQVTYLKGKHKVLQGLYSKKVPKSYLNAHLGENIGDTYYSTGASPKKYVDKYKRGFRKNDDPTNAANYALGKSSLKTTSKKKTTSSPSKHTSSKHHEVNHKTSKGKSHSKSKVKSKTKTSIHKDVVKPKKRAPKLTRAQKLAQIKHYQGELMTKHDYSSKQFKNTAKFSNYVRRNRSHYSIPKTKKGSLDLSKATPKQLTKGQQAGIRKKLIADQKSLGPNKSAGKSLNVGNSAKQSAPQSNVATNTQTNPYANKQAITNQSIANQSQQPQATGQVAQQPAVNQYGGQQTGIQSIHPLAGRFMMRMHQATNAGLSAIRAGAGRTMPQNQVGGTGQQFAHQAASQVSHTVQQPIQRATNGVQFGNSGAGMGSAIQHGLAQDRQTQQTAQAGTQRFTSPQNQPSNQGTQFTQPTTTTATPSASVGTNQPRTAQLGGNNAYQSQFAQSQNTANQTTPQSQNQFGE